jgi:alginate O-acetyltransferase complex protein AlgI
MLLGGLWHGAGWTFVIWGGLHGTYLLVNHAWVGWRGERSPAEPATWFGRAAGWALTFFAVMVAWVFFRADSPAAAVTIFQGMAGLNQAAIAGSAWEARVAAELALAFNPALLVALLLVAVLAPNSNQILGRLEAAIADGPAATRSAHVVTGFALACGVAFFFVFKSFFSVAPTPFLYFNF